jgi:hypothetical protein
MAVYEVNNALITEGEIRLSDVWQRIRLILSDIVV